jgi:hypothetical protein
MVGEHVCDVDDEDESIGKIHGVVVGIGNGTSLIKWPRHAEPQTWDNADLEPAWD